MNLLEFLDKRAYLGLQYIQILYVLFLENLNEKKIYYEKKQHLLHYNVQSTTFIFFY